MDSAGRVCEADPASATALVGVLYAAAGSDPRALEQCARQFSPRIEVFGEREVTLDLSGLSHLFGDARAIAAELRREAADRGLRVRVAIAGTRTAARLLVRHRAGLTVIEPGTQRAAVASLPIALLAALDGGTSTAKTGKSVAPTAENLVDTLRRWGLRTLGELAALAADDVAARLGQDGVAWQRIARADDPRPLVPTPDEERFEQTLELDWPIDGLQPLSFVLGRLMDPLAAHLERRHRAAAILTVSLRLVDRTIHERSLELPSPIRDARTLRTLALLDLESHPPGAAIDRVSVAVAPTPGRIVQFSLLTRPLPSPEQVSTLMARLTALMGEGRCGSPTVVDSWEPGVFAMKAFAPGSRVPDPGSRIPSPGSRVPVAALRRFRHPIPARVRMEKGAPQRVTTERHGFSGGRVQQSAGPWRTSGGWWQDGWDRDEWDVTFADGGAWRVFRERETDRWFVEAILD